MLIFTFFVFIIIANSQDLIRTINYSNSVYQVRSNFKEDKIATAGKDSTIRIIDLAGKELRKLYGHNSSISSTAFSANNKYLATGAYDNSVNVWSLNSYKKFEIKHHNDAIKDITFASDNSMIGIASRDKTASLWSMEGKLLAELKGHEKQLKGILISDKHKVIITCADDGAIIIWDYHGTQLKKLQTGKEPLLTMKLSDDQHRLYAANRTGTIYVWDLAFKIEKKINAHEKMITYLDISKDSRFLFYSTGDGLIKIWDLFSDREFHSFKANDSYTSSLVYLDNENVLVASSGDRTLKFWDMSEILYKKTNNEGFYIDFFKQIAGNWNVKSTDRISPGNYENNVGKAAIELGFDGKLISMLFNGSFKNKPFNISTSMVISDSTMVQLSSVDSEHRRMTSANGFRSNQDIEFIKKIEFSTRTMLITYVFKILSKTEFSYESYLASHSINRQLTHRRIFKKN